MPDRRPLDGLDGADAYELACARGFRGSLDQWLASLKGERGADGPPVPVEVVRELVQTAVDAIPRPADGVNGADGKDGAPGDRGPRGPRGERGKEGAAAALPPLQPSRAQVHRDADTKLWTSVRVPPLFAGGQAVELVAIRDDDSLIEFVDLIPEPA